MVKDSLADYVAAEMNDILQSEELQRMFNKTAAAKKKEFPHGHKEHDCNKKCPKNKDKKDKDKKKSKAEQLELAVRGLEKIGALLDDLDFPKSAVATIRALEVIVSEASGDSNDDSVNYGVITPDERGKALKHDKPEHGTKAPINEPPKAEPAPKRPSTYKPEWAREKIEIDQGSADDNADNDALKRDMPEHGTKAPVKEAPKAQPKPLRPSTYKPEWERDKGPEFEFDMSNAEDDDDSNDCGEPGTDAGYAHEGGDELVEGSEELRELLEALGLESEAAADAELISEGKKKDDDKKKKEQEKMKKEKEKERLAKEKEKAKAKAAKEKEKERAAKEKAKAKK